jgi:hypothetical protein
MGTGAGERVKQAIKVELIKKVKCKQNLDGR